MQFGIHDVRDCLCLHSRRTARQLTQYYDGALRPTGLRITQFQLLAAIDEAAPVTQQQLARLMGIDRTTLTRNLALLQRDGLIDIAQSPDDRREHQHRLTSAGRKAKSKALPLWQAAQQNLAHLLRESRHRSTIGTALSILDELSTLGSQTPP